MTLSFSTFTHMKSEAISQMLYENGKIDLKIKPKDYETLELTIIPKKRAEFLESLEQDALKFRKNLAWEKENQEAIAGQNNRIKERGAFGDTFRRF